MIINPFAERKNCNLNEEVVDFVKNTDAQWYIICEKDLGEVYVKHGATLLPNNLVEQFIHEEVYETYDDGVSFVRGDDRADSKKVVVLLTSLTIYENVFNELNRFNIEINSKQDAIDFIYKFNDWVLSKNDCVEIFEEWYEAISDSQHYLSIDSSYSDKCLYQLCKHYLRIGNYISHDIHEVPLACLRIDVDECGVSYSSKRLLSVDKDVFKFKNYIVRDGVEAVSENTFLRCKELEHITLPVSMRILGANLFYGCSNLKELILPENVVYIGECLCEHCSNLERVVLSDKIRDIKIASFYCCESLSEVKLPKRLRTLSDNVFAWTPMTKLDLPSTVNWIGGECFWHVVIENLKISKHAHIAEDAFLESKTEIEYI